MFSGSGRGHDGGRRFRGGAAVRDPRARPSSAFRSSSTRPHSGRHYPDRFLAMARLDRERDPPLGGLLSSTNCSARAVPLGAPLLAANFPRAYLDVNREPWELDPRMFAEPVPSFANIRSARVAGGLGTVPKLVGEGLDIYPGRLPLAEALAPHRVGLQALSRRAETAVDAHPCALRLCRADRLPFDAGQHPRRRNRRPAGLHHRRPLRRVGVAGADRDGDRAA